MSRLEAKGQAYSRIAALASQTYQSHHRVQRCPGSLGYMDVPRDDCGPFARPCRRDDRRVPLVVST